MAVSEHHEKVDVAPLGSTSPSVERELDAAHRELEVARGRKRLLSEQVALLEKRLLEAETRLAEMQRSVERASTIADDIQRTTSWRVTAPLRAFRRLLKRP